MSQLASIAFHTLGCKLNFSETSTLSRQLENEGFVKKDFDDVADVYLINTCSVTENADKECRAIVRKIQRKAPDAFVVITGCYAQLKPQEIAEIDGVDLVLGAAEKFNISHHLKMLMQNEHYNKVQTCDIDDIEGFHSSYSFNDRTRTFLKVQDGCDYSCTFCTIPLARGHSRSDTIEGVMTKIRELEQKGVKEVVLTGINLGDFGKGDHGAKRPHEQFYDLIQVIDAQSTIPRYRISSIEPNLLSDDIIDFVARSERFMPHFHIPLQSGSNDILSKMKRRYRRELYADRIAHIKRVMPHACIGVDVIVGFPGETNAHFEETVQFLKDLDVSYFHVFTYSERDNTEAAVMTGQVPIPERQYRNKVLRQLSYKKLNHFTELHNQETRPVLFESNRDGWIEGYSDNYIKVKAATRPELENAIVDWVL